MVGDNTITNSSFIIKASQTTCVPGLEDGEGGARGKSPASLGKDGSFLRMEYMVREEWSRKVILGWLAVSSFPDSFQALPGLLSLSNQVEPGLQSSKALLSIMQSLAER